VLDVPPAEGMARFAERDRIEAEGLEFHEKVREMFLTLAESDTAHYLVVDARAPMEDVAARVRHALAPFLTQARRA
jgi:dTMP kinase